MWVWVNSGSWWWTGRPDVLRFMGSQRVGHDWATELNWTEGSGPITSCQIDGEKVETVTDFIFLGSKVTADSDCSHEIKRVLLLERKAMTNIGSVLKSRDITLPTKVHIVKAIVFFFSPNSHVRMWELNHKEGWELKNWCFQIVVLEKTLESPLDSKEIRPVNPKGNQPEYSLEGLMLNLQYFGHLMGRANSLEKTLMLGKIEGKRRRGWQRTRSLDSITDLTDLSLSKLQKMLKDREVWCAAVHGFAKSQMWLSDWIMTGFLHL